MNGHRNWGSSEEHQPITWLHGYAIYTVHLIVIVYVVLMIVTAIIGPAANSIFAWLGFSSDLVWSGQVWRLFTYGLFNRPSLSFVIDMLMLIWFGRELEKHFGRRIFSWFYGGVYLVPVIVLTLIGLVRPTGPLLSQPGTLAVFVGFATLYPGAMLLFGILAKWAAIVFVALFSLIHLADRNWVGLMLLWSSCGFAHLFVRYQQGIFSLPSLPRIRFRRRKPKLRVLPDLPAKKTSESVKVATPDATMAEVDALLDKIAKSGIGSLTASERARLDAARADLLKRSSRRG